MEEPVRPCVFVLGGAKISDAFLMMKTVLERGVADKILTGGLVGNIFLTALGKEIGPSLRIASRAAGPQTSSIQRTSFSSRRLSTAAWGFVV